MSRTENAVVWVGDGVRLVIGEAHFGPAAIYALQVFDGGKYGRQDWRSIAGTRASLSEVVRDFAHLPGVSGLSGMLPEDAAFASKRYWRYRAEEIHAEAAFSDQLAERVVKYRDLEQAAIFEQGLCDV